MGGRAEQADLTEREREICAAIWAGPAQRASTLWQRRVGDLPHSRSTDPSPNQRDAR